MLIYLLVFFLASSLFFFNQKNSTISLAIFFAVFVFIAGFRQRLFRRGDIDHAGGVGDMRDLRIGRLCSLRKGATAQQANRGNRRAQSNEHGLILLWRPGLKPRAWLMAHRIGWRVNRKVPGKITRSGRAA